MTAPQPDAHRGAQTSPWLPFPPTSDGSYLGAALRAGAIALVLLALLAVLIVL